MFRQAQFQIRARRRRKENRPGQRLGRDDQAALSSTSCCPPIGAPGERFFGMTDRDKLDDTVNFLVWRHQADQMGVRLTDADIGQMIAEETRGELTRTRRRDRRAHPCGSGSAGRLLRRIAVRRLGDEFRVRMAQLALTGTAAGDRPAHAYRPAHRADAARKLEPVQGRPDDGAGWLDRRAGQGLPGQGDGRRRATTNSRSCSTNTRPTNRPRTATCRGSKSRGRSRWNGSGPGRTCRTIRRPPTRCWPSPRPCGCSAIPWPRPG